MLLKDADDDATGIVIIEDTVRFQELEDTGEVSLDDMQTAVGGLIEAIPGLGHRFWCNEEGMQKGLEPNPFVPSILGPILVVGCAGGDSAIPLSVREYKDLLNRVMVNYG